MSALMAIQIQAYRCGGVDKYRCSRALKKIYARILQKRQAGGDSEKEIETEIQESELFSGFWTKCVIEGVELICNC